MSHITGYVVGEEGRREEREVEGKLCITVYQRAWVRMGTASLGHYGVKQTRQLAWCIRIGVLVHIDHTWSRVGVCVCMYMYMCR